MQKIIIIVSVLAMLLLREECHGQGTVKYTAGISYGFGDPTYTPTGNVSKKYVNLTTLRSSTYSGTAWVLDAQGIDVVSGCAAPAYTPGLGQSNIAINNCTILQNGQGPELYNYTGSAWLCLNCSTGGGVYTGGEGIVVDSPLIRIDTLDRVTFATSPTLPGGVGTVRWNDTDGTAEIGLKGGNVTLQLGQEQTTLVKHADNSGLANGSVVYVVGSDGANKTVRYAKADAESTSANTFGVMTESATGGAKAFCTTFGLVRDLNTSALTEGAMVWVSAATAGVMTTTRPTAPNHAVQVGFCIRSHATQGVIFVSVQNGYELGELHDVTITSPTTGQALLYDTNKWVNGTLPSPSSTLDALTDVTITSPANNQILQYNTAGSQWVNATLSAITGSGISSYIPVFNSSSSVQAYSNFYFAGTSQGLIVGGIQFNGYGSGVGFTGQGFASPGGNRTLYMKSGTNNNASDEAGIWIDGGTLGGRTASSSFKGIKFFSDLQSNGPGILNTYAMISVEQRVRHSMATVTGFDYNPQLDVTPTNNYAALFRTGTVAIGTALPNSAAKLDVISTTQGVLFPRMTGTQRDAIASPPDGLVVYNTTAAKLQVRAASAWVDLH